MLDSAMDIVSIAAGERFSVVLYSDGRACFWGENSDFDIGLTDELGRFEFIETVRLDSLPDRFIRIFACDRRTAYLAVDGSIYLAGPPFRSNRRLHRVTLPGGRAVLCCATGPDVTWVIDKPGIIHRITNEVTNSYQLPVLAVDIATGEGFAIALDSAGHCWGIGCIAPDQREQFSALPTFPVGAKRVFARYTTCVVLTPGRVFACFGIGEKPPQELAVVAVPELDGQPVCEVAIALHYELFLTENGTLWARGSGEFGALFTGSANPQLVPVLVFTNEPVAAIATGRCHSLALCGAPLVKCHEEPPAFRRVLCFYPGDIVRAPERGIGHVLRSSRARAVVQFPGGTAQFMEGDLEFVSRDGLVLVKHDENQFDGGELSNRLYGVSVGDVVRHKATGSLMSVLGVAGTSLCLWGFDRGTDDFAGSFSDFFGAYVLEHTIRDVHIQKIGGLALPVETLAPFPATWRSRPVFVKGKIASFYAAEPLFGTLGLIPIHEVRAIEATAGIFASDRAVLGGQFGTVLSLTGDTALFLSDDKLADGATPDFIPMADLVAVATIIGQRDFPSDNGVFQVRVWDFPNADAIPSDIFVGSEGFVTVLGVKEGTIFARDQAGQIVPFSTEGHQLVRRSFPVGHATKTVISRDGSAVAVSLFLSDMAGTGFLQGDEVLFQDEIRTVMLGKGDGYLWVGGFDGTLYCAEIGSPDIRLERRPVSDPQALFRLLDCS